MRIRNQYQCETEIRHSRFICLLSDISTEEDARLFIRDVQKAYRDATHVCTAYVLGPHHETARSSDNGEPAGTAGMPMLEALKNSGLTNVCACVVRYFGGIKLGTGGLVRAYGGIVTEACRNCPKAQEVNVFLYSVTYDYSLQGSLETVLRTRHTIRDISYDNQVHALVAAKEKDLPQQVEALSHGQASCTFIREETILEDL
jgi:uncharacterized YigZ family protein